MLGTDTDRVRGQLDLDGAIEIRSVDQRPAAREPIDHPWRRVAVIVVRTDRDDGHRRVEGLEEGRRGGGVAPVVADLEQIDRSDPPAGEDCLDPGLDVAGEQESPPGGLAQQDDRGVVDRRAVLEGAGRHRPRIRPQRHQGDIVERDAVPGGQAPVRHAVVGDPLDERLVAGAVAGEPAHQDPPDPVAIEHDREARDVVLVRVGQDQQVEPPVPGREPAVERAQQTLGVRPAVDEGTGPMSAFDEDRVALADIEHGDRRDAPRLRRADRPGRNGERRNRREPQPRPGKIGRAHV